MARTAQIQIEGGDLIESIQTFCKGLLQSGAVDALLAPRRLPVKNVIMPTLVMDPEQIQGIDPLAPVFPINAAKVVSRLTRRPAGARVAAMLRPCEMRAFVELVKLKQARVEDVVLIGVDCYGAYGNLDYQRYVGSNGADSTRSFLEKAASGKGTAQEDFDISPACKACEHFVAEGADLIIGLMGVDTRDHLILKAQSEKGEMLLTTLEIEEAPEPPGRAKAVEALRQERVAYRDRMFEETSEATADLTRLTGYLAGCVNCYNCRVACPVCYCKECVFVTDVFDHEPAQYLRWANRKGVLKMPTDTVFYHLTRLAHMSTACIGCGQCSNACPNHIPVMELFRTVAHGTQKAFDYQAGRSIEEEAPLAVFREKEFSEVTGGKD